MPATITVLVASYNYPERLHLCLEAIHRQIYQDYEIIVTDDGSDGDDCRKVAEDHEARWVTRQHDYDAAGNSLRNTPAVLNQGVALAQGDIVQILQRDHIIAPDFLLWLARCWQGPNLVYGLTDHHRGLFTMDDLDSLLRNVHLPDHEVRYDKYLNQGRATLVEFHRWQDTDGMDVAFHRAAWIPMDTNFIGQDHSCLDWTLRMQTMGMRFVLNPMMRLWHMEQEQLPNKDVWMKQIADSGTYMQGKYGDPDVMFNLVIRPLQDVSEMMRGVQQHFGVLPQEGK